MVRTIKRDKIRDVVATQIKSFIVDENLKSGDRLPTETELATRFGVSRLSLREATKALEFLGIVEARPGRGLTVGHVNMDRVTEYLGFHPALHDVSSDVLIDTRILIESGVLTHVARRMKDDPSIYANLNTINEGLRRARSLGRWVELDIAFHRGLIEASGLSPVLAFGDLIAVFFQRFRENVAAARWKTGVDSHQQIIDDLRLGEVGRAGEELRRHIESHREPLRTDA
ncbi:FadR/GntR family transcriptional regulator [Singulisphaera sp. PoT]|uniref:FadR/GntR family transcriptional regulator n=1 Tax=Singulisphaera sp. PoT TaxID=3411797 RepID=UPI003BF55FA3